MGNIFDKIDSGQIINGIILIIIGIIVGAIIKIVKSKRILLFLKKLKLEIFPGNFNVVLSIEFKEGLNSGKYFEAIKNKLNEEISNCGVAKFIIIKDCSDIVKFKNKEAAESFIETRPIDLIVWGSFSGDELKVKGKLKQKLKLFFTYMHPEDRHKKIGNLIKHDVQSKIAMKRYWDIVDDNSLNDVETIADNIFFISSYILGMSLKFFGKLKKSTEVFESTYKTLLSKQEKEAQSMLLHLLHNFVLLAMESYCKGHYKESIDFSEKILSYKKSDFYSIANMAVCYYKLGKKNESRKFVDKLDRLYRNRPITKVDMAFFMILEGKYKEAYEYYEQSVIVKFEHLGYNPLDVVEFLIHEYDISKNTGILYGIGIISYHYGDKDLAKQYFNMFLKDASVLFEIK